MSGVGFDLRATRAFVRDICEAAGDPGAADRLLINDAGTRLTFTTVDAGACGASIAGFLKPERASATIRTALSRILRQRARDRAIIASGDTGLPVWSIDIHPLALAVLRNGGVNPIFVAMLTEGNFERNPLRRASEGTSIRVGNAGLVAGRATIATITGNGHPTDDAVSFHEGTVGRTQWMTARNLILPDTVLAALPGRRLDEVVSHPLIEGAGHVRIASVETSGDVVQLEMEDVRVTLHPVPEGLEDWLRFPWNPSEPPS